MECFCSCLLCRPNFTTIDHMLYEEESTIERRISVLYNELQSRGVVERDDVELHEKHEVLRRLFATFEYRAQDPRSMFTEIRKVRILGQTAFLTLGISEEDEVINKFRATKGWTRRADLDKELVRGLRLCFSLTDRKENHDELTLRELELDPEVPGDLKNIIYSLIDQGSISNSYGGFLLLLLDQVQAPEGMAQSVVDTARQQGAARLRQDARKHKTDPDTDPVAVLGLSYVNEVVGNKFSDITAISELALRESSQLDNEEEMQKNSQKIELTIQYALNELYGPGQSDVSGIS